MSRDTDSRNLSKGQVLITWPDYPVDEEGFGAFLKENGLTIRLEPRLQDRAPGEVLRLAQGSIAAIVSTDPFDRSVFAGCPDLRVIARVGVGVDSIDLKAATDSQVAVTTTPGANEATVADHTLALILAVLRRVTLQDADVRRGGWNRTGDNISWDLTGLTVGLVGYGTIGQLVARRLRGFNVNLLVTDPADVDRTGVENVSLDELLQRSDVVSLHAPLLASTQYLRGAQELARMKSTAVIVNTSRGGLIDQSALVASLASHQLRGAGLDVFETEPPTSTELLSLENVVLSPHIGGISARSIDEMLRRATNSVIDVLSGIRPKNLVNAEVMDVMRFGSDHASLREKLHEESTQR
jgi:phosphoglycerate dehydrogenase-like enzyme